jgi:antibiotic biosynthesis monooxygenase (ABM) superfamily enzyme
MSETATDTGPVSATVVFARRVRPGREDEYLAWQAEMNDACRTFPGCEGVEMIPPVPGIQEDYVVIYRFDSFPHLGAWLRSDTRQTLLVRGQGLFAGAARQHVVAGRGPVQQSSGMLVATRVKPGREREYRAWQDRINAETARFPGFLENEVFPPVPGLQDEWVVLVRFDTPEHLRSWLSSDVRKRLLDEAARLWHEAHVERFSGAFPAWFGAGSTGPGGAGLPADWKQAMIVLLVLYPTVMLQLHFLSPWLASLPLAVSTFIGNMVSVVLLTWLLMPLANRAFGFWLAPTNARGRLAELRGIAAIVAGYALAIATFLALR